MNPRIPHRFLTGENLPETERGELVRIARRLRADARAGRRASPLRGCHLAISADCAGEASTKVIEEAAVDLGAHVSRIGRLDLGSERARVAMAHLLAGLYDAIACEALAPSDALALERLADIPLFVGLGSERHPIRQLLPMLLDAGAAGPDAEHDELLRLIQAVLVECMV